MSEVREKPRRTALMDVLSWIAQMTTAVVASLFILATTLATVAILFVWFVGFAFTGDQFWFSFERRRVKNPGDH